MSGTVWSLFNLLLLAATIALAGAAVYTAVAGIRALITRALAHHHHDSEA